MVMVTALNQLTFHLRAEMLLSTGQAAEATMDCSGCARARLKIVVWLCTLHPRRNPSTLARNFPILVPAKVAFCPSFDAMALERSIH